MEPTPPGSHHGYPDSVDSSPRSRNTDSWDEPPPPGMLPGGGKLRLMCSYGGHIVPRPHDRTLCYLGGDTRIVVVDRLTSLSDLSTRLSRTLLDGRSFTLKYQLPNEDLDSLISVTTDEDLENMIEEYDRTSSGSTSGSLKPSRLRLFLFPSKPDSAASSSIGSLLDDSKSETWFVDALNGASILPRGLSSDSNSVNCLLGLDDAAPVAVPADADPGLLIDPSSNKPLLGKQQEIHSVPDSPMMETGSSFGSTSSAPSLSNLPPIRVHSDGRVGLEEQFAAMMTMKGDELGFKDNNFAPNPPIPTVIPTTTAGAVGVLSPPGVVGGMVGEIPIVPRVLSEDERSDPGVVIRKPPQPPAQKASSLDSVTPDAVSRDNYATGIPRAKPVVQSDSIAPIPLRPSAAFAAATVPDLKQRDIAADQNYRVPVQLHDRNLILSMQQPEQQQAHQFIQAEQQQQAHQFIQEQQQQAHQFIQAEQQQQQQAHQFIHAGTHYIHRHPTGAVPLTPYYIHQQQPPPQQQQQQLEQHQYYYVPMRQNPAAIPPVKSAAVVPQQVYPARSAPLQAPPNAELYRTGGGGGATAQPPLIHMADAQHQYMGYHQSGANFAYEYVDPVQAAIYYTQPTSAPLAASQYQTVTSAAAMAEASMAPPSGPAESKQTRS